VDSVELTGMGQGPMVTGPRFVNYAPEKVP
jgi:hypothetical protein